MQKTRWVRSSTVFPPAPLSSCEDKNQHGQLCYTSYRQTYKELLEILADYKAEEQSPIGLVCCLMTLLDGHHNDLILGLNEFLPEKYKIETKDCSRRPGPLVMQLKSKM